VSAPRAGTPIRVLVADDHPVVREGLVAMLRTQPDFEIVGEAATGREVLDLVARRDPDVLLLDLEMPDVDGVSVLRQLRESSSRTRAIVFTVFDTDDRIIAAVEAGAAGYLLKGVPRSEIFAAVRAVHAGGSLLEPVVASKVLRHVRDVGSRAGDAERSGPALTARERSVLELIARGRSNKQIAAALAITERTVKFHVSSIFAKLGAGNRADAVSRAVQAGLIAL
jgi:two-component system, NarL family, response regulator LiaR